jgi:hypothetical protein
LRERLNIEPVGDHYETYAFCCRGHVAPEMFVEALNEEYGNMIGRQFIAEDAKHIYARLVPTNGRQEFDLEYLWPVQRGRGAFPVTLVDVQP